MRTGLLIGAGLVAATACRYQPSPVPVLGDQSSAAAMVGEWRGTYYGTESGRSGIITFTIRAGGDGAFGEVFMESPAGATVIQAADDPAAHRRHVRAPQMLAVRFVDILGGDVEGRLEPYIAPDCKCTVQTTFSGRVVGDTVRGSFITRGQMIAPQTGVWAAARTK